MSLVNLCPGVWFLDEILRLPGGFRFPTRGALFALQDGSLMLISPPPRIGEVARAVAALGPVSAIVEPCANHHVGLAPARAAFPGARTFGPPGLARKLRGQPPVEPLPDGAAAPWAGTVETIPVEGMPRLEETAFFHRPSGTLWLTDVAFNIRTSEHLPTRLFLRLNDALGRFGQSRIARSMVKDPDALRRTVERLLALRPARLLPAHGDPLEVDATRVLAGGFAHLPAC